ncbi:TPA: hypothetical protein SAY52_005958 [Burkholderia cenocepacia]|uniref:hypothetical protein n=1 Tax=unclassified Burkholderia TaxID=2613784 RepID=UPI00158873B4|nr:MULTISPECIES: hypothetical protein [unclassified Burkholderia]HEF5875258.1 hypothetical protein [Burkholderia cenocepacia]
MNANVGIVLRKRDREAVLLQLARQVRTWGDEVVEVGEARYGFSGLDDVEFQIYPVTPFVLGRIPAGERVSDLEYAWMTGAGLDRYVSWAREHDEAAPLGVFEESLVAMLSKLHFWAVLCAPEGDRLETFVRVNALDMVQMLRRTARDLIASGGFLAISL